MSPKTVRATLVGAEFDRCHAKVFDDGHIEFYPLISEDASLSVRTLAMMDSAMANLSRGKTGFPMEPGIVTDQFIGRGAVTITVIGDIVAPIAPDWEEAEDL
jgi:hypothetical protein